MYVDNSTSRVLQMWSFSFLNTWKSFFFRYKNGNLTFRIPFKLSFNEDLVYYKVYNMCSTKMKRNFLLTPTVWNSTCIVFSSTCQCTCTHVHISVIHNHRYMFSSRCQSGMVLHVIINLMSIHGSMLKEQGKTYM